MSFQVVDDEQAGLDGASVAAPILDPTPELPQHGELLARGFMTPGVMSGGSRPEWVADRDLTCGFVSNAFTTVQEGRTPFFSPEASESQGSSSAGASEAAVRVLWEMVDE